MFLFDTSLLPQWVELLGVLVMKDLRVRYLRSFLGYLWVLLSPLASAVVYYTAFKVIMRVPVESYSVYILTGLFPWFWASNVLNQSTTCLRSNTTLIKRVAMPRAVLPLSVTIQEGLQVIFSMPVLIGLLAFCGGKVHGTWLVLIPAMLVLQALIIYPMALVVAMASVYLRDLEHLVSVVITMAFYLTPICYSEAMVPPGLRSALLLNPFWPLIQGWHQVILDGKLEPAVVGHTLVFAATLGLAARLAYTRLSSGVGDLL